MRIVLIVEEAGIGKLVGSVLSRAGQPTMQAGREEARELIRAGKVPLRALVTNTPGEFHEFAGKVPVVYTTSCPDPEIVDRFRPCEVVKKPFHGSQLLSALEGLSSQTA